MDANSLLPKTFSGKVVPRFGDFSNQLKLNKNCKETHIWVPVTLFEEKAMAPHSSTLAWKIPWTEEPGGLQSMRLLRVGYN